MKHAAGPWIAIHGPLMEVERFFDHVNFNRRDPVRTTKERESERKCSPGASLRVAAKQSEADRLCHIPD